MEIPKSLNMKKYIKISSYIVASIFLLYLLVLGYSYIFEGDKITIDKYNFEQLGKVRSTLDNPNRGKIVFNDLKEFNTAFNTNILPIKNCYYTSSFNGNQPYMFGFQLESLLYKFFYFRKYYIYPKYDIPYDQRCYGLSAPGKTMAGCDYDDGFSSFMSVVSSSCEY